MNLISFPNFTFDPATGRLEMLALGQLLQASIQPEMVKQSAFVVPYTASLLLKPLALTVQVSWNDVECEADIERLVKQEAAIQELMAIAFWAATSGFNLLQNVRRVSYAELVNLTARCHEFMQKTYQAPKPVVLGPGVMTIEGAGTFQVKHMVMGVPQEQRHG